MYTDPTGHAICIDGGDFCVDQSRNRVYGERPNSWWLPVVNHEAITKKNLQETADFVGRVINEPYDWFRIGVDCIGGICSEWDLLGLFPILPAGITRFGDDVIALLPPVKRIDYPWHHLLPKRFREQFEDIIGIGDINHHLVSLPVEVHHDIHSGGPRGGLWNEAWDQWLRNNPNATPIDVFKQVGVFIHEFGLDGIIKVEP